MNRGLSKNQTAILELLAKRKSEGREWNYVSGIIFSALYPDDENYHRPSEAQYQSFCRAIRLLAKKGLIETRKKPVGYMWRVDEKRGGVSSVKEVRLSVESKEKTVCSKQIEAENKHILTEEETTILNSALSRHDLKHCIDCGTPDASNPQRLFCPFGRGLRDRSDVCEVES
jgi:hypothetical protein